MTNGLVGASAAGARSGPSNDSLATENSSVAATEDYVAPKLVYSVKPVSPTEALRNYVTGNVNVDALVDVTGHVKSVTVISGPQKLRNTAIAEMKQYIYDPARKNGKPVKSHVQVSLKYWYEP
ncbi:MAG TPA: energy transducer TonB [Bryobacteraceae bacterium]|nr:energy transducer TonB [Bryobacteraceae bacterium]